MVHPAGLALKLLNSNMLEVNFCACFYTTTDDYHLCLKSKLGRRTKSLNVYHAKASLKSEAFTWYTTAPEVYTQLKQEGRRWREILDPMYREYKLQIRGRD